MSFLFADLCSRTSISNEEIDSIVNNPDNHFLRHVVHWDVDTITRALEISRHPEITATKLLVNTLHMPVCEDGRCEKVRVCLEAGADTRSVMIESGDSHLFSPFLVPEIVDLLAKHGIPREYFNMRNKRGFTPFEATFRHDVREALVRHGAKRIMVDRFSLMTHM